MGEISFLYQAKALPRYEQAFRYWYSETTKYSFAYQRYVTLSDTSIINSPVAITKVAAGLSSLYGLFVTNREPMIPDMLDGFNVYKNPKDTIRHEYEQVRQDGHSMIDHLHELTPMEMGDVRSHFEIYNTDAHLHRYIYVNDNSEYTAMLSRINFRESLNILEQYFGHYDKFVNWYDQIHGYVDRNGFNILPDILTKGPDITVNYTDNLYGDVDRHSMNILSDNQARRPDIIGNAIDNYFGKRPDIIGNVIPNVSGKPDRPITVNWLKGVFGRYPAVYALNYYPSFLGERIKHTGSVFDVLLGPKIDMEAYCNPSISSGTVMPARDTNIFYNYLGIRTIYYGEIGKTVSGIISDKFAGINNQYYAKRLQSPLVYWDYTNCSIKEVKYGFYCNDAVVDYAMKYLGVQDEQVFGLKDNAFGMYDSYVVSGVDNGKDILTTTGVYTVTSAKNTGILYNNTFFDRVGKEGGVSGQGLHINKVNKTSQYILDDNVFIMKYYKEIGILNTENVFSTKTAHDMRISMSDVPVFKDRKDFRIFVDNTTITKERLPLAPEWEDLFIYKVPKDMEILKIPDNVYKVPYSMEIKDTSGNIYKVPYDLYIMNTDINAFKTLYDMWIESGDMSGGTLTMRDTADFKAGIHALKKSFEASYLSSTDTALKDWLPVDLANSIADSYAGMIIPCSKSRVQAFVDDINEMAIKIMHNAFIPEDISGSVIPKDVAIPDMDLYCDKDAHQVFMDNHNYWAVKSAIRSAIYKDEFVTKDGHQASYLTQIWTEKDDKSIFTTPQDFGFKNEIKASILEQSQAFKDTYGIEMHKDFFVDKENKVCYYYYDVIAEKDRIGMIVQQDTIATQDRRKMTPLIDLTAFLDSSVVNMYEPMLYVPPVIRNMELLNATNEIKRVAYDVTEFASGYDNWAWVYEPPDPFDNPEQLYGIDELLLPENDTRYEDFENIIFDKESLMPRDPVRMIDNTTFIARYPIQHPISDYADIGKIYDDSAESWQNYFGIETDVMHEIFLKYYQIWQARIFEFSTMTMQQATKRMLDLLYTWITLYYPVDKMEQALRVFRQIRWYSESAIIRNSQYIVSYEYDTLRSNLHTGKCEIPNDLDENENPTMYITNGVIRNNPAYIGQEASVTFTIETQKNTWFRFSLSNQIGTVKVYVNDVLVAMYPKSGIGYTIELPYTTGTNYVRIVKEANHNLDDKFYIGYIEVPEASFKDLTIKFDPVLRAGNKPLDEVAKKLIAFANLHANRNEMYEVARRSNVGISETYKKMNEYWKNHHQSKSKGKRLTIKQV